MSNMSKAAAQKLTDALQSALDVVADAKAANDAATELQSAAIAASEQATAAAQQATAGHVETVNTLAVARNKVIEVLNADYAG